MERHKPPSKYISEIVELIPVGLDSQDALPGLHEISIGLSRTQTLPQSLLLRIALSSGFALRKLPFPLCYLTIYGSRYDEPAPKKVLATLKERQRIRQSEILAALLKYANNIEGFGSLDEPSQIAALERVFFESPAVATDVFFRLDDTIEFWKFFNSLKILAARAYYRKFFATVGTAHYRDKTRNRHTFAGRPASKLNSKVLPSRPFLQAMGSFHTTHCEGLSFADLPIRKSLAVAGEMNTGEEASRESAVPGGEVGEETEEDVMPRRAKRQRKS